MAHNHQGAVRICDTLLICELQNEYVFCFIYLIQFGVIANRSRPITQLEIVGLFILSISKKQQLKITLLA